MPAIAPQSHNPQVPAVPAIIPRSSRQVTVQIPAATSVNGQITASEVPITAAGNMFYVIACSSPVIIQSVRGGGTSVPNLFGNAQGQPVSGGFDSLIVKNSSLGPITALIWVGFDTFINNQLVLANSTIQQVAFPTYQTAASAAIVNINDLSGTIFTDINGNKWGAIQRVSILVFNTDSAATLLLQKAGSGSSSGPAVGVIYPLTPVRFDFGGNYRLNIGGGNINAIVSEIYQAVPSQ